MAARALSSAVCHACCNRYHCHLVATTSLSLASHGSLLVQARHEAMMSSLLLCVQLQWQRQSWGVPFTHPTQCQFFKVLYTMLDHAHPTFNTLGAIFAIKNWYKSYAQPRKSTPRAISRATFWCTYNTVRHCLIHFVIAVHYTAEGSQQAAFRHEMRIKHHTVDYFASEEFKRPTAVMGTLTG